MIRAMPLSQEAPHSSSSFLPIALGVVGGGIFFGGVVTSRRNRTAGPAMVIGGLIVIGVAGTIYVMSRNGQSGHTIETSQALTNPQSIQARHYSNTKEWDITYNEDGLPIKIVKHVKAEIT